MATVNKIEIAGLEGNEAAQPRVFAHSAKTISLPSGTGAGNENKFVYVIPNTNVTPSANDIQTIQPRGACIYIGNITGGSTLDVELEDGSRVLFKGLTAGSFLPILATKIYSTDAAGVQSTTVDDILALF